MAVVGHSESWLVNSLPYIGQQPSVNHEEAPAAVTWQLILAAQQADAIVSYFSSVQTFELTTHKPQRLAEELCQFTGLTIIEQFGLVTRDPYSRVLAIPFLS